MNEDMKLVLEVSGLKDGKTPTVRVVEESKDGPGDGYRWLATGESKRPGDQYFSLGEWTGTREAGNAVKKDREYRRKVDDAPGAGWRWLEPGEKRCNGDEVFHVDGWIYARPYGEAVTGRQTVRRKIGLKSESELEAEVFILKRQLAACKRAAQSNTTESAEAVKRDITGEYATDAFVAVCDAVKREMNHRESRNPLTPEQAKVVSVAASGMRTAAAITKSDFSREILTKQADVLESIEFGGLSEEDRRAVSFAVKYMRGNSIAGNIMDVIRRLEKVASGGPHDAST